TDIQLSAVEMSDTLDYLTSEMDAFNDEYIPACVECDRDESHPFPVQSRPGHAGVQLPPMISIDSVQLSQLSQQIENNEISALSLFHVPYQLCWPKEFIDLNDDYLRLKWTF